MRMRLWIGAQQDQTVTCVLNRMPALADRAEPPLLLSLQPKATVWHTEVSVVTSGKAG